MVRLAMILLVLAVVPSTATRDVNRLGWLEGVWSGTDQGIAMEEHWSSPSGGGLIGMHKDSKNGRMTSFEFFRIVATDTSGVCYLASPLGRAPVPFCATALTDSLVVFENLSHDFPQRIVYRLQADGRLYARIEGTIGGAARSEEWTWVRTQGK
jgi:hypothetical protein